MPDNNQVVRYGREQYVQHEDMADEEIFAGALVERTATGVQNHSTAGARDGPLLIALDDRGRGMELGDSYPIDDNVKYVAASGGGYHLRVAAGAAAIAVGDVLVSAGDGTVRAFDGVAGDVQGDGIAEAQEAVDNSAGAAAVYISVEVMN